MRFLRRAIERIFIAALGLLLGICIWVALESRPIVSIRSRPILVEIEKGWGVRTIADSLKKAGVLTKTTPFVWRYRLFFHRQPLKAGQYEIAVPASPQTVIETLIKGLVYLHPVTVAKGLTGEETFPAFLAAGFGTPDAFAAAFKDTGPLGLLNPQASDLEGYLFPETYRLAKGTTAADVVKAMVEQFRAVFADPWRRRTAALGMSVRDAVILASLIEKETGRPEEKALVSSVFHNRLKAGMKLDCDPTIIYALKRAGIYDGKLHGRDLRFESPYNTYRHAGLPPGPIANPGRASLEAALHPAETEFLYFVARRDGGHQFSRTLREHNAAVDLHRR